MKLLSSSYMDFMSQEKMLLMYTLTSNNYFNFLLKFLFKPSCIWTEAL